MLHLYQSNRLEHLGTLFTGMVQAVPLSDPFQPEVVMVQSRGMGRWLTLATASASGIAAHLQFVLPAGYAWRLMRQALGDLPEQSAFAPEVLTWRLTALLPQLQEPVFAPVQHYLQGGERAVFELAGCVADIFDQYLVFRPDWIRAWERGELQGLGPDEAWQAALWRRLADEVPGMHRVRMSDAFLAALTSDMLPERITLFGIASLAPMYLALVRRLAELTDVCLFLLNPCQEYWGNIVDARGQLRLSGQGLDVAPDHPLLASLGKQGRDFFDLVSESMHESLPAFAAPQGNRLLNRLQRDMLTLQMPAPEAVAADDSIEIHATHGAMRELEVLKDRLLARFAADPTLTPADVAVLTPDINQYAPYIDAVFGARPDAPGIPYSIADRRIERDVPLLSTLSGVLTLLDSRFPADRVMALLDCPALLRRFGLTPADVPLIQGWVEQAAIRWGRDANHKAELGLPADPLFTWRWGLDRLLLGCALPPAMAGRESPLWQDLLPLPLASGGDSEVLARFSALYDTLDGWARQCAEPADAEGWQQRLQALAADLLLVDETEEDALQIWREALTALVQEALAADFARPFGLAVLRDWLSRRLSQPSAGGFLTGGVTFCAMVPMRSIPFRVLCLIGMNDGAYPRDERPVSFDLIAQHPRRGDRSRRFDDRYLFLEALLSARETLYLSYVGLSARSNEALPPSALVSELLDTLLAMGATPQMLCVAHPLQPFSPTCYDGRDERLRSFEPAFAQALIAPPAQPQPFAAPLDVPASTVLEVASWLRFWRMPCRAWLSECLGIRVASAQEAPAVREPFVLEREYAQSVVERVVEASMQGRPLARVGELARGSGWLPPGALGEAVLSRQIGQGRRFAAALPPELADPPLPPVVLNLQIDALTLVGTLSGLRPQGRLLMCARPAFATELLDLWLGHLLLCAARPQGVAPVSMLFAVDGTRILGPQEDAVEQLRPWLAFWQAGQRSPLPFFARTSLAYARHRHDKPDDLAGAMVRALGEWAPAFEDKFAQKDDPAVALAFRHQDPLADPLFIQLAEVLLLPMLQAMSAGEETA
ncbi:MULTISPECIES: exodeoxyribonuclease V subunit gamma [unclassified Paludibacterium]|uniref:exodeoxyribonuclease V subunit gamma n=1 Tax=unclassified Paludibacterium TaxID=2618429 RepID=UPI001C047D56|nr:exodeoxyribonuclease V subunit gamma [Paludibacterium sp. B53371]BEV73260.1 exodeoxyribonuclease V subunit gamma [Paludibacterium sp. THUN1379]